MSNTVRNGFSTLNRLLGKKNKNSSLSKSTSNLSTISNSVTSNSLLDTSSQHNKILPLAASTNAPFEQTFRITICLPRDQLYVVRVGAKTKLYNLLEMVCFNKQLDMDKYEFRHPGDSSQIFNNEWTIGEVGLNEIRLSLKTDRRDAFPKFHTDEIIKLRHNNRDSISSSEMSKQSIGGNTKYIKTISPYSSTNSLNSIDMTDLSNNSRTNQQPPVAPVRKKRMAPRPPSQNSIPENQTTNSPTSNTNNQDNNRNVFKVPLPVIPRKKFHESSPNLANPNDLTKAITTTRTSYKEFNNNIPTSDTNQQYVQAENKKDMVTMRTSSQKSAKLNGDSLKNRKTYAGGETTLNHSLTSSDAEDLSEEKGVPPEPIPRKRPAMLKKKAPPAPAPRGLPPVAPPRNMSRSSSDIDQKLSTYHDHKADFKNSETSIKKLEVKNHKSINENVSKTTLNQKTELNESITSNQPNESQTNIKSIVIENISSTINNDITTPDASLTSTTKMSEDTSSDEDETTNIYSIQLGKPMIIPAPPPPIDLSAVKSSTPTPTEIIENIKNESIEVIETSHSTLSNNVPNNNITNSNKSEYSPDHSPTIVLSTKNRKFNNISSTESTSASPRSESPIWTYTLPAPPTLFADNCQPLNNQIKENAQIITATETIVSDSSDLSDFTKDPMVIDCDASKKVDDSPNRGTAVIMTSDIEDGYLGDRMKLNRIQRQNNVDDNQPLAEQNNKNVVSLNLEKQSSSDSCSDNIDTVKNNVLNELNDLLINKIPIIRNNSNEEANNCINSNNEKSSLDNFSIQTYAKKNSENIPMAKEKDENVETTDSSVPAIRKSSKEFIQIKRSSLTNGNLFRTAKVNRSDSFHSTAQHDYRNGKNPNPNFTKTSRSSSYISLFSTPTFDRNNGMYGDQKLLDESNRRKSASELSIADLPSLQSLFVMKSILSNSRLNFDSSKNVKRSTSEEHENIILRKSSHDNGSSSKGSLTHHQNQLDSKTVDPLKQVTQSSETIKISSNESETSATKQMSTANENKKWKYQGPPSINLSTWGDRPKSQIVIKSDTDYKFGGAVTNRNTITHSNSSNDVVDAPDAVKLRPPRPVSIISSSSSSLSKPDLPKSSTRPMSMIEHNHLPIVRGVEYKKNIRPVKSEVAQNESVESIQRPSYVVSTFMLEKPTVNQHISTMTLGRVSQANRFAQQKNTTATQTFTLNRGSSNVNQFSPVVKGFQNVTEHENKPIERTVSSDSGYKSLPMNIIAGDQNHNGKPKGSSLKPVITATKSFDGSQLTSNMPFSQFSLRKTGLKDRILAESVSKNTCDMLATKSVIETVASPIQLRQKNVQSISSDRNDISAKQLSSEQVCNSMPSPPPPPNVTLAPPIIRSVTTKNHQTIPVEPRDQLLDSIRSFNKSKLRRK